MLQKLFIIGNYQSYLVIGTLIFFGLLETLSGQIKSKNKTFGGRIKEVGSFFLLSVLIKPAIVISVLFIGKTICAGYENSLEHSSIFISLPVYLIVDDFLQYWYHRVAHQNIFLWNLHRSHHQAEEMGLFTSYRNATLYYILQPNIWCVSIFTFAGAGIAVAIGLALKQGVNIITHSKFKWDKNLYRIPVLSQLMILVERIIVTPAFHHAHHGKSKSDGISSPDGNFGNIFSIWDQLFGTALFTRKFPAEYGLKNDAEENKAEVLAKP